MGCTIIINRLKRRVATSLTKKNKGKCSSFIIE